MGETVPTEPLAESDLDQALRALLIPPPESSCDVALPTLNGFECLTRLGQGGMGAVYLAQQDLPRRLCTVKLIPKWEGQAIEREAHLSARLEHPGIARIYSVTWTEEALALVGEWVDGYPLSEILRIAPKVSAASEETWVSAALRELELDDGTFQGKGVTPPSAVVVDWMRQVASALRYAHERGVTHCDIKPSNLMLRRDGRVVLIDFGIATMGEGSPANEGSFVGSFGYAAPEQLHGRHAEIGPATDAFAMGATFLQLFTGVKPFDAQTLAERLATVDEAPKLLRDLPSRRLQDLLGCLLHPDSAERLAEMDTVLRKLGEGSPTSSESLSLRQPKALLGWKIAAAGLVILVAFLSYRYTDLEQRYDDIRIEKRDTLESIHTSIVRHSVSVAFRRYLTTCFITEDVQPGTLPSTLKFRARMTLEGKLTNVQLDGVEDERVRFCVMATMLKVQIPSSRFLDRRDVSFEIHGDSWR